MIWTVGVRAHPANIAQPTNRFHQHRCESWIVELNSPRARLPEHRSLFLLQQALSLLLPLRWGGTTSSGVRFEKRVTSSVKMLFSQVSPVFWTATTRAFSLRSSTVKDFTFGSYRPSIVCRCLLLLRHLCHSRRRPLISQSPCLEGPPLPMSWN